MTRISFEYVCHRCPGDGVIRGKRPGIDWPAACPCGARRSFSQYQLGRMMGESPKTLQRIFEVRPRVTLAVAIRVLEKIAATFPQALR